MLLQSPQVPLRSFDLAVIIVYLAGVTWFGARFRKQQHSLKDYFLGGRSAPWWAIALSIVSAETSTLTIIGTPPLAFGGSFVFLQVVLGYLLARIVIATIFLPRYFEGQMLTAYELMERRFGPRVRKLTAAIFLVTRSLAEGVRVFAISIVISIILHTSGPASILVIVALTLFYTFEGGMTAVIWTDVIQMGMYVFGAAVSFYVLLGKIPGGFGHVVALAGSAGKAARVRFPLVVDRPLHHLGRPYRRLFSHHCEPRYGSTCGAAAAQRQNRTPEPARPAYQLGRHLCAVHALPDHRRHALGLPERQGGFGKDELDRLYPSFIWESLPPGIAGLAMAAIIAAAMANLSAALNSLASATVFDFYQPLTRARYSPAHYLEVSRVSTVFWGGVLAAIASGRRPAGVRCWSRACLSPR